MKTLNKKTGIEELAEISNVSVTTVSRFFNHPELLSEKTKNNILNAITKTGYQHNSIASSLAKGETNLIGLILPNLKINYFSEVLNNVIEECKKKDYNCLVYTSDKNKDDEIEHIKKFMQYNIKGLIILSHLIPSHELEKLDTKIITMEREGGSYKMINSDNLKGGQIAARKLIDNKCKKIYHINNGYNETWPSFKRIVGFELESKHIDSEVIIDSSLTDTSLPIAKEAISSIIDKIYDPYNKIGIFASNDNIAVLIQNYCLKKGFLIPNNIEIIGYDNALISNNVPFPITTIDQNIELMAKLAVDSFENYSHTETIIPATLIEKESTT